MALNKTMPQAIRWRAVTQHIYHALSAATPASHE
jgi:hypothetical protein